MDNLDHAVRRESADPRVRLEPRAARVYRVQRVYQAPPVPEDNLDLL